jgi:hypothetical protein
VSGASPTLRSRAPSTRYDLSCRSPSPSLHRTSQHAAHAPRLAPRRTRVLECVAHATSQPMPLPSVHRGQGSQRAKRYRSAGEPFNSHACTRAPPCCPCASNGLIRLVGACVHMRACRYEQADIGTAVEYLRSRPDTCSSCLWGAWLAGPRSHGTQVLGVGDGRVVGVMAIVSIIRMLRPYRPTSRTFR